MSYCRFVEADIYLYADCADYVCCCACHLAPIDDDDALFHPSVQLYSVEDVIAHIGYHRAAGHYVPPGVEDDVVHDYVLCDEPYVFAPKPEGWTDPAFVAEEEAGGRPSPSASYESRANPPRYNEPET